MSRLSSAISSAQADILRNQLLAQTVINNLKTRNINGYYAENRERALDIALQLLPTGCVVCRGGSLSVDQIGLGEAVKSGKYMYIDRNTAKDRRAAELAAFDCDVFLCGVNALTEDGILINMDGYGNRVAPLIFGPKKVVMVAGMNKVTPDLDSGMKRVRFTAAPKNSLRFNLSAPCSKTGTCSDCKSPDTICCQMVITRFCRDKDRVHLILVNDNLGY